MKTSVPERVTMLSPTPKDPFLCIYSQFYRVFQAERSYRISIRTHTQTPTLEPRTPNRKLNVWMATKGEKS